MNDDRIEKSTVLRAPRSEVWHAISDSAEFGKWFGIELNGEFVPGARLEGRITHPGYEHLRARIDVERVQPEWLLSWRWHPSATDPNKDYSKEPRTLVMFQLSDAIGGTKLTVTESGFENIPVGRRQEAFTGNESGWTKQMESITNHLARAA